MPRPSHLSSDNILRFLQVRRDAASVDDIAAGLHMRRADRNALHKMLNTLKKRHALEELPGGRYRLAGRKDGRSGDGTGPASSGARPQPGQQRGAAPDRGSFSQNEIKGRLVLHHDGYGFVVPDPPVEWLDRDVFIPRDAIEDAMHGDTVLVKMQRVAGAGESQRTEGRIVRVLGRAHPSVVGLFRYGTRGDTVLPYDARKQHLPHVFAAEVMKEAEQRALPVSDAERADREDFRRLPIVTIDGETARDFDDAVYVERRADGGWHLQVHIADVAHYVRTLTELDSEARLRGTSVYFPDRAVPMLPEALSNGMCSLKPHEDRLVMSALMEFDAAGNMKSSRMTSGVIRSAERMTYTNVNKVLEADPEMSRRYASLAPRFRDMKKLALLLNARRNERGSIDFDLPEPVIEFDEEQRMTNITRSERNIAHRLIEEFMLAANRAVAAYL